MHSGEKSNKCNQCEFASSRAGNLRTHMLYHARRKEVAVKVREGKNYTFRDEVRSLGMVEFTRIF